MEFKALARIHACLMFTMLREIVGLVSLGIPQDLLEEMYIYTYKQDMQFLTD